LEEITYPYCEQSDVYSFAILFWLLLTKNTRFNHIYNEKELYDFFVTKGHRPSIPPDWKVSTIKFLNLLWNQDPNLRPDFEYIVDEFENKIGPELLCPDKFVRKIIKSIGSNVKYDKFSEMWTDLNTGFPFPRFIENMFECLNISQITSNSMQDLKLLMCDDTKKLTSFEAISRVGSIFGPIGGKGFKTPTFFSNIKFILKMKTFHGYVTETEAEEKVINRFEKKK